MKDRPNNVGSREHKGPKDYTELEKSRGGIADILTESKLPYVEVSSLLDKINDYSYFYYDLSDANSFGNGCSYLNFSDFFKALGDVFRHKLQCFIEFDNLDKKSKKKEEEEFEIPEFDEDEFEKSVEKERSGISDEKFSKLCGDVRFWSESSMRRFVIELLDELKKKHVENDVMMNEIVEELQKRGITFETIRYDIIHNTSIFDESKLINLIDVLYSYVLDDGTLLFKFIKKELNHLEEKCAEMHRVGYPGSYPSYDADFLGGLLKKGYYEAEKGYYDKMKI